jgi:hypothetical protein
LRDESFAGNFNPNHQNNIVNLGNSTAYVEKAQKKALLITDFVLFIFSSFQGCSSLLPW